MTGSDFVTHTEFDDFRRETREEFAAVREELAALRREMREEFMAVRREMQEAVAVLTQRLDHHERWLTVLSSGQILMLLVLIYVVFKLGL